MKRITVQADEDLIERARSIARADRRTLSALFREWLEEFTPSDGDARSFDTLMARLDAVNVCRYFSRDERTQP